MLISGGNLHLISQFYKAIDLGPPKFCVGTRAYPGFVRSPLSATAIVCHSSHLPNVQSWTWGRMCVL